MADSRWNSDKEKDWEEIRYGIQNTQRQYFEPEKGSERKRKKLWGQKGEWCQKDIYNLLQLQQSSRTSRTQSLTRTTCEWEKTVLRQVKKESVWTLNGWSRIYKADSKTKTNIQIFLRMTGNTVTQGQMLTCCKCGSLEICLCPGKCGIKMTNPINNIFNFLVIWKYLSFQVQINTFKRNKIHNWLHYC